MENCIFCKIIDGQIPSNPVLDNEWVYAFNDINPEAPHHILIVPKKHRWFYRHRCSIRYKCEAFAPSLFTSCVLCNAFTIHYSLSPNPVATSSAYPLRNDSANDPLSVRLLDLHWLRV